MLDLVTLTKTISYGGIFIITFAESGLLIGFFLPGDSLLFTAGLLASQNILDIMILIPLLFFAAVAGDTAGYAFGHQWGQRLLRKKRFLTFDKTHVKMAENFFKRYGAKTIVIARFLPVIRTLAPILAGIGRMPYTVFFFYNIIGALLWSTGLILLGYFLGQTIPNVDQYILPLLAGVVLLGSLPYIIKISINKKARKHAWQQLKSVFQ